LSIRNIETHDIYTNIEKAFYVCKHITFLLGKFDIFKRNRLSNVIWRFAELPQNLVSEST